MKRLIAGVYLSFLVSMTLLCTNDRQQRALRRAEFEDIKKQYAQQVLLIHQRYQECVQDFGGATNELFYKQPCKQQTMVITKHLRYEYERLVEEACYTNQDYVLDKVDDFWRFLGYQI